MNVEIIILEEAAQPFETFLHDQIKQFNNVHSPAHKLAREPGVIMPLNLMLRDDAGEIVGGLAASSYWGWLDIDNFFVPEELRGQGIGARLLEQAEAIAIMRGCTRCFLSTYAFQARRFYEKQGYQVVGELVDYPPGSSFYWMQKVFT
jgi:GNAT superfamily N-acetyltransferase